MTAEIGARALKARLAQPGELALIDVREHGQYGEGHVFLAVSLPYSRFELGLPSLVPNPAVELILCDGGDGVAHRAARRAAALGYERVRLLQGGVGAWRSAGYTLYAGVNVPSKVFGELIEQVRGTPHIAAETLNAMRVAGESYVILDGRPVAEYRKMSIPGGICCPNGELALRVRDLVPDAKTPIIVNCAGRTRSIIGAQTLIDLGVPNPVYALENGTQGWSLAGLELERNADRLYRRAVDSDVGPLKARARDLAAAHGVPFITADVAHRWCGDNARTSYLIDVRTAEEFAERAVDGFVHAPGGQLIQATDQWIGVRGARLVLADDEEVRAPVVAAWLRQLGHDAYVLAGGLAAAADLRWSRPQRAMPAPLPTIAPPAAMAALTRGELRIIDVRAGTRFRQGHIAEALWSIRPRLAALRGDAGTPIALVADDPQVAALAALDLADLGSTAIHALTGDAAAWRDAGFRIVASADQPTDADMIDFLFFTSRRHDGDAEAARQYLAWEIGLIGQLDAQERACFRLPSA
jgi:rhodanese-related sulfurtransferase